MLTEPESWNQPLCQSTFISVTSIQDKHLITSLIPLAVKPEYLCVETLIINYIHYIDFSPETLSVRFILRFTVKEAFQNVIKGVLGLITVRTRTQALRSSEILAL